MQFIVDRTEGRMLVLENESGFNLDIPKNLLPDADEGDCVNITVSESGMVVKAVSGGTLTVMHCRRKYRIPEIPGLAVSPGNYLSFSVDAEAAASRRQSVTDLENDLFSCPEV